MILLILPDVFLLSNDISFLVDQEVLIQIMPSHINSALPVILTKLKHLYIFVHAVFEKDTETFRFNKLLLACINQKYNLWMIYMIFHPPFQITDLKNFKIKNVFMVHAYLNKYLKVNNFKIKLRIRKFIRH